MDFNGDLNLATLQPAPVFPELYQELWWYSGSDSLTNATASGSSFVLKGSTSTGASSSSAAKLYTLSSQWSSTLQYAFEASICVSATPYTAYAVIYDITSSTVVSASQISTTTASTLSVIRSGKFTLTPGHSYGITIWCSGGNVYITDASLIVFPSSPLTSPSVSAISLANPSGNTLKEAPIPLWVYSSGTIGGNPGTAGSYFVPKGSSTLVSGTSSSATKLYNLSSNWSSNQKFAFETSIYNSSSGAVVNAEMWDMTSNTAVSASQVSVTSTTATLIRSGSFTLTPGHSYGITIWGATGTEYLTKAHLVALAQ